MNFFRQFDWGILFATIALSALGLLIQLSVAPNLIISQLIFVVLGFILFYLFSQIEIQIYTPLKTILYIGIILGLVLTFIFGTEIRGSTRWIIIGLSRIQPSEITKPFIVVVLAIYFALPGKKRNKLLKGTLLLLPLLLLVFKQPDLGNTIIYIAIFLGILVSEGYLPIVLGGLFATGILTPLIWRLLQEYQQQRIITFLNPGIDPQGTGYNALQAAIAVGSGGLLGKGLGRGTQSHLSFLPEHHTDFVFASFAEEFGFIGASLLIFLYLFLLIRILKSAHQSNSRVGSLVGIGVFSMLFTQIFINIGMNIGLVPITGITLPLLSYGGSSMVSTMISLGIVESLGKTKEQEKTLQIE